MEQYNLLSDEELISRLREGHEDIRDYLMEKHKNLVRKKARALYLIGGDNDDLIQEGMIGLYKAIRDFDPERGASFHTFADLCISRQLYTGCAGIPAAEAQPLNSYVSLSDSDNEEQTSSRASYAANDVRNRNPEELFIARENLEDMEDLIEKKLSRFEREVLRYYLSGMNYSQIADTLGKSSKATDNALQRIKKKIKQITEN